MRLPILNPKPAANSALMPWRFEFEEIGTQWVIEIHGNNSSADIDGAMVAVRRRISQFDKNYSRFRPDSLITQMAYQPGSYQLPDDAQPMFDLYQQVYELSNGQFTPLVGQALADAGYDAGYGFTPKAMTPTPSWEQAMDYHYPTLTLKQAALLDVGAMGKGYLVDIVGELLEAHDIHRYTINAGGDIRHRGQGSAPLRVGLEHPLDATMAIGVASINNQSICGSATNRRAWGRFHHILDPRSHRSPQHIRAIWTVADTTILADAITTALFFISPKLIRPHFKFEYAIIYEDLSLEHSTKFPAEFFDKDTSK